MKYRATLFVPGGRDSSGNSLRQHSMVSCYGNNNCSIQLFSHFKLPCLLIFDFLSRPLLLSFAHFPTKFVLRFSLTSFNFISPRCTLPTTKNEILDKLCTFKVFGLIALMPWELRRG